MTARATAPTRAGVTQSRSAAAPSAPVTAAAITARPRTVVVRRERRFVTTAGSCFGAGSGRSHANGATPRGSHAGGAERWGVSSSTPGSGTSVSLRRSGIGDVFLSVVSVDAVVPVPGAGASVPWAGVPVAEASVMSMASVASVACAGGVASALGVAVAAGPACMFHAPVCAPHGEQYEFVTGG